MYFPCYINNTGFSVEKTVLVQPSFTNCTICDSILNEPTDITVTLKSCQYPVSGIIGLFK